MTGRVDTSPTKVSVCTLRHRIPPPRGRAGVSRSTQIAGQSDQSAVGDLQVQVQMLTKHGQIPTLGSAGAAGFNVYAAHPSEIRPGCRRVVQLGIALSIPAGFYAQLQPRSGLAKNKGIDVAAGVIDSDFRGNIGVLLVNIRYREIYGLSGTPHCATCF